MQINLTNKVSIRVFPPVHQLPPHRAGRFLGEDKRKTLTIPRSCCKCSNGRDFPETIPTLPPSVHPSLCIEISFMPGKFSRHGKRLNENLIGDPAKSCCDIGCTPALPCLLNLSASTRTYDVCFMERLKERLIQPSTLHVRFLELINYRKFVRSETRINLLSFITTA